MSVIAIEIAHAYVAITPSLRGAQRQIESQLAGVDVSAAGSQIGEQLSRGVGRSLDFAAVGQRLQDIGGRISDIGGRLTKYVTAPALVAAGAVAGITASLGWGRLVSLDSAQAQLRGLGYEAQDVERISAQVTDAVMGGMTTMAEGTAIAAGALAAGVEEGAELERYIRLVGDAAVGANRPVNEMAQIFNRVQGGGRLMTQELNMIEDGLPGFTAKMAEAAGVSQQEFRKMVTAGEVGSEEFLAVMDDFAGGMATAYADSWSGMVANTKAWVGIIGENILRGVFQDAKLELADFQEWLQTDEVQQWAQDAGAAIGRAFSRIVEGIRSAIDWWGNLSSTQREVIGAVAGIAVAAGPVLWVVGKIISGVGTVLTLIKPIAALFAALTSPIGLVVAGIAAVVAGLVYFFTQTELGQQIWERVWAAIKVAAQAVADWFTGTFLPAAQAVWGAIVDGATAAVGWFMEHILPVLQAFGELVAALWNVLLGHWNNLWAQIQAAWEVVGPPLIEIITLAFENLWTVLGVIWDQIKNVVETTLGVIRGIINVVTSAMQGDWSGAWEAIRGITSTIWDSIKRTIENAINSARDILSNTLETIKSLWSNAWTSVKDRFAQIGVEIVAEVTRKISDVVETVRQLPGRARDALGNIGTILINAGRQLIQGFIDGITAGFGRVRDKLGELTDLLPDWKGPAKRDRNILYGAGGLVIGGFVDGLESEFGTVRSSLGGLTGLIEDYATPSIDAGGLMGEIDTFLRDVASSPSVMASASLGSVAGVQSFAAPSPGYLVLRDVDGDLIGRMKVEADEQITSREKLVDWGA